ncbi:MAG: PP2C family protein-serine/threonine phosphatase [Kiritimatiellae bacterium]|nr:PP2C family protein-serine/threonine phosphatase [Kiritimatiellia bacterium]MDW8459056.1 PP2C family protein-serine/threonine phosphatase [Verrucomicrobiota bacterium]
MIRIPIPQRAAVRMALLAMAWAVVILIFALAYRTASKAILDEIRAQAKAVAIALAAAIDPDDVTAIREPADVGLPSLAKIQRLLSAVTDANPDIRYVYVMRRDPTPGAPPSSYVYVVDEPERDRNGNGQIDPDERSQPPGTPYDASAFPAMVSAWDGPSADEEVTADPPYPDSISGYAPIRDAAGQTVAIVGVDILAETVHLKKAAVRRAAVVLALAMNALITMVLVLYRREHLAMVENRALARELAFRNEVLQDTNRELERLNRQYEEELALARDVQLGLLPRDLPRHARLAFERCFVTCAMLGGDLYDVFTLSGNRIALYVADVSGHGAGAALISGLIKMAVAGMKGDRTGSDILERPARVIARINELVARELPPDKFVTMIYAVIDIASPSITCRVASAGHPPPIHIRAAASDAFPVPIQSGPALVFFEQADWPESEFRVEPGDKLAFFTDGIPEAMNERHEEFGDDRLLELLRTHGREPAPSLMERVNRALAAHRGTNAVSDDYTLLIAEFLA